VMGRSMLSVLRSKARHVAFVALAALAAASAVSSGARAQVSESERAAARQLFHEGDDLQRAGKLAEALDKFQRAQQVFSAPTNMLRIAECDAALGRLVASAEAYRALVRTPLPPGSPPAFQAAVDQARGELAQVEPRVPRLVVQIDPAGAPGPQLQIDGQSVSAALLGEPFPLDPGPHKVLVSASGLASAEQTVVLKERETRSLQMTLHPIAPIAGVTYAPGSVPLPAQAAPARPDAAPTDAPGTELPPGTPPPPPPIPDGDPETLRKRSRGSLLFGLHLGVELPAGQLPVPSGPSVDASSLSGGGLAYALDGGVRFARQWYVGLTLEHAGLGAGSKPTALGLSARALSSNTTAAGAVLGFIVNPDRPSFFGEVGLQFRWYDVSWTDSTGPQSASYTGGELLLGMGLWLPAGRSVRFIPEVTAGLGAFNSPPSSDQVSSPGHGFVMIGLAGLFNVGL
jgi:hypothetical protein